MKVDTFVDVIVSFKENYRILAFLFNQMFALFSTRIEHITVSCEDHADLLKLVTWAWIPLAMYFRFQVILFQKHKLNVFWVSSNMKFNFNMRKHALPDQKTNDYKKKNIMVIFACVKVFFFFKLKDYYMLTIF